MAVKEIVNVGVIGTGFARTTQIPGFLHAEGARVFAIASARRERAAAVAREFEISFVTDNWREVVEHTEVDLVSIVTPPSTHREMALAALDAGKAVLCEKPMAMSAAETEEMRRRAHEVDACALIDHELRFLAGRREMRRLLGEGLIGRVRHAKLIFRADSRASGERAWDWWSDAAAGGGALGAIGSHAIDSFRWLLQTKVSHVCCQLATHVNARPDKQNRKMRPVTTDDEANLLLRFSDGELTGGATGQVSLSVVEPGEPLHMLELFGERGALRVEDSGALWHAEIGAGTWGPIAVEQGALAPGMRDGGWSRGFTRFAQEITDALRASRPAIEDAATFDDGHAVQLVLDAARRSHQSECWENVDE